MFPYQEPDQPSSTSLTVFVVRPLQALTSQLMPSLPSNWSLPFTLQQNAPLQLLLLHVHASCPVNLTAIHLITRKIFSKFMLRGAEIILICTFCSIIQMYEVGKRFKNAK